MPLIPVADRAPAAGATAGPHPHRRQHPRHPLRPPWELHQTTPRNGRKPQGARHPPGQPRRAHRHDVGPRPPGVPCLPCDHPLLAPARLRTHAGRYRGSHKTQPGYVAWRNPERKPRGHPRRCLSQFRVPSERGALVKLGRRVCWILAASMPVVILLGCGEIEDDEEWQRELEISTTRPQPSVTVGPWVTCVVPPLCNEYLTYSLQAWDDIYYSCQDSSDGRECPSDYNLRCTIEYDDRDDIERRVLYGAGDQISSVRFTRLCNDLGGI